MTELLGNDLAVMMDALRDQLVADGLVRKPSAAGFDATPDLPPMWLAPEGGAIAPGDRRPPENDDDLVVTAMVGPGIAARPYEEFLRRATVDVWMRASGYAPVALEFEASMRESLLGELGRRGWVMGGPEHELLMQSVQEFRPVQPMPLDAPGHAYAVSYLMEWFA